MAQHDNIEKAIADAVAAGVPREQAERIVSATRASSSTAAAPELDSGGVNPVRVWFDVAGWKLDPGALRSGLELLGADEPAVDGYLVEAGERRVNGHLPAAFKGERWIVIPKWDGPDGFQHYKDRDPIWIKNYRELLTSEEYIGLSMHQRGVLHGLWLEYAASNRQITDSTLTLTRRLGGRVATRDLEALNHAGFIQFAASKPLAPRYQSASPEKSREETPTPSGNASTARRDREPRAAAPEPLICPVCDITKTSQRLLDEHLVNVHGREPGATA